MIAGGPLGPRGRGQLRRLAGPVENGQGLARTVAPTCPDRPLPQVRGSSTALSRFTAYRGGMAFDRITRSVEVMGGKPCIRGTRLTVGTVVGLVASGKAFTEILDHYPYLNDEDIRQALSYAAWRVEEIEIPIPAA